MIILKHFNAGGIIADFSQIANLLLMIYYFFKNWIILSMMFLFNLLILSHNIIKLLFSALYHNELGDCVKLGSHREIFIIEYI